MAYAGDLTARQAYDLLADDPAVVLVDVRTKAEWAYVGTPDLAPVGKEAVLVEWLTYPAGTLNPAFLDELAAHGVHAGTPVLFLCRSGVRSVAAAELATRAGFTRAWNVSGGFEGPPDADGHRGTTDGWKAAGLPWKQS